MSGRKIDGFLYGSKIKPWYTETIGCNEFAYLHFPTVSSKSRRVADLVYHN